jgi:hypothetical protein
MSFVVRVRKQWTAVYFCFVIGIWFLNQSSILTWLLQDEVLDVGMISNVSPRIKPTTKTPNRTEHIQNASLPRQHQTENKTFSSPVQQRNGTSTKSYEDFLRDETRRITNENPVYIVMETMGELGNYLHFLAHGYGLFRMALQEYGIVGRMILRRRKGSSASKAKKTMYILRKCFINFEGLFVYNVYDDHVNLNEHVWLDEALEKTQFKLTSGHPIRDNKPVQDVLKSIQKELIRSSNAEPYKNASTVVLRVSTMINSYFLDRHYETYRKLFAINETKCCKQKHFPQEDESIFVSVLLSTLFHCLLSQLWTDRTNLIVMSFSPPPI